LSTHTIPPGTHFQFRSFGDEALAAIGVTIPPWPSEGDAFECQADGSRRCDVPPETLVTVE
jgi:mannose-6-phosphate isomerase-like protein (cupin superfamily)